MPAGTSSSRCARAYFGSTRGAGPGPVSTQAARTSATTNRMARSLYDQIGRVLEQGAVCRLAGDDELFDLLEEGRMLLRDHIEVLLRQAQEDGGLERGDVRDGDGTADERDFTDRGPRSELRDRGPGALHLAA